MAKFSADTAFARVFSSEAQVAPSLALRTTHVHARVLAVSQPLHLAVVGNGMLLDLYNLNPPKVAGDAPVLTYEDRISLLDCGQNDDSSPPLGPVVSLAFSPRDVLYIGTASGHVISFRIRKRVLAPGADVNPLFAQCLMQAHIAPNADVTAVLPSPVSKDIVLISLVPRSAGSVASLHTIYLDTGTVSIAPVSLQLALTTAIAFSPCGQFVATCDVDAVFRVWSVALSADEPNPRSLVLLPVYEWGDAAASAATSLTWSVDGSLMAQYPQLHVRGHQLVELSVPIPLAPGMWFEAGSMPDRDLDPVSRILAARGVDPIVWRSARLPFEPSHLVLSLALGSAALRFWPVAPNGDLASLEHVLQLEPIKLNGTDPRGMAVLPRSSADEPIILLILTDAGFNSIVLSPAPPPALADDSPPVDSHDATAQTGDALHNAVVAALAADDAAEAAAAADTAAADTAAADAAAANAAPPHHTRARHDAASLYALPPPPIRRAYPPRRESDKVGRLSDLAERVANLEAELVMVRNSFVVFSDAMTKDMARVLSTLNRLTS
ncbi:uncharacterized protein AMSG_07000 [Thecamonas trahens ATCC 50062]|uniref:Uncharacterized protein n=1 Tax=Thecamonas trahens ATCC 50062 TaxID=461836 RepID=A0A0L0DFF6_THETB|nr:hypothetical protein AMSG_07000 [Thecamonas trahens ATCC 50062]KNC51024.1 hypothetical protein AMSG_07000 [Thecamonas trahens ATCC 50062]|eukprot:XP_013756491.1 hypothetical protein AMSG_07000 [Thecamonas trahens ATCC 50062]